MSMQQMKIMIMGHWAAHTPQLLCDLSFLGQLGSRKGLLMRASRMLQKLVPETGMHEGNAPKCWSVVDRNDSLVDHERIVKMR